MDLLCQVVFKKRAILYVYCEFLFLLVIVNMMNFCYSDGILTSVAGSVYFLRSDHRLLLLLLLLLLL